MWENEKMFSRYLIERLKRNSFVCNRIETHGTLNGMPDMFVQGHGMDTFIELKNMKNVSVNDENIKVSWRPGQVAWATVYRNTHLYNIKDFDIIKCSWTFIGCKDGVLAVPMCRHFENNMLKNSDVKFRISKDENIRDILMAHSQLVMPVICPGEWSMYDFIYNVARNYQYMFAGTAESDIDWPCTEIIAQSIGLSFSELKENAPADYYKVMNLSYHIASVIYSCYDNWQLNK